MRGNFAPIGYKDAGVGTVLEAREDIYMFSGTLFLLKGERCTVQEPGPGGFIIKSDDGAIHALSGEKGCRLLKVIEYKNLQPLQKPNFISTISSTVSKARRKKKN